MTSVTRCLQGKRQINVFDRLIQVRLFPFYIQYIDSLSFTWNLVVAESKTVKQSAEQEMRPDFELCKCLKKCYDLSDDKLN